MKKEGKSKLIHARLLEHEKLDTIMEFFQARYRKVFGKESKRHVPVALAIDFAVDLTADLISNPDLFVASESRTLADLSETVTAEVQKQVVNILRQNRRALPDRENTGRGIRYHRVQGRG